jgi:hypothetical protein
MTQVRYRRKPGPGGVDDGLPQLPDGEPLLQRWFAVAMVVLVPVTLGVLAWAFLAITGTDIGPEERRPPGTEDVTHERGDATLNEIREAEAGPWCAEEVTIIGDEGARAAARRALSATCQLLATGRFPLAEDGLERWADEDGVLRMAVFELTGVESSARTEAGGIVVELNAKFQFEAGAQASPMVIHQLTLIGQGMPGVRVTAEAELVAAQAQHDACERLAFGDEAPRGCRDVAELLALDDPLTALHGAGFPREGRR